MERGAFAETPVSRDADMFVINVMGTRRYTRHALPATIERRHGRIINLSSQLARAGVGTGGFAAYAATKGAIESFTRALAHEVGDHGITVNAIAPGGYRYRHEPGRHDSRVPRPAGEGAACSSPRDVEDVAYCALFLAADQARYLTGQVLHPSGGGDAIGEEPVPMVRPPSPDHHQ
jgi:3-oxoacyl-[acyl-carrier protein] reductase